MYGHEAIHRFNALPVGDLFGPFHERDSAAVQQLAGMNKKLSLVNDGSPDNSLDIAVQLTQSDLNVVVVVGELWPPQSDEEWAGSRHGGACISNRHRFGRRARVVGCFFGKKIVSERCDVVFGVQMLRKGGFFEQVTGRFFYRMFRMIMGITQPNDIVTARLMSKRYVDALIQRQ